MFRGITNARVVTSKEVLEDATVTFEDGCISGISRSRGSAAEGMLDAGGRYLLPGLVDLHSDAIEKQLAPRSGVEFAPEGAFLEMDNYFAASGITTGFHALSFMDSADRSMGRSRILCEAVLRNRAEGLVHHEMHLRCELPDEAAVQTVERMLYSRDIRIASMMDHTPGQGQFRDLEWFRRYWVEDAGADESRVAAALEEAQQKNHSFAIERVERLTRAAGDSRAVLASHDDDSPQRVESLAEKGVKISEFPIDVESAHKARELGMSVCMGAPNAVRGVSSGGNLCAREAVKLGLVDVLCSDYHPPSMLRAAFKLARSNVLSLPAAVALVSRGPARAAGMPERGEIREGGAADLIVVGERLGMPSVSHALVGGIAAFATEGAPRS